MEIVTEEEWSNSEVVKGIPEGGEKFERRAGVEKAEKVLLRLRDKVKFIVYIIYFIKLLLKN